MNWFKQLLRAAKSITISPTRSKPTSARRSRRWLLQGVPREEAEYQARREFGNVTLIEERGREVWAWPALESILADIKFALRQLRKSPVFTLTTVAT